MAALAPPPNTAGIPLPPIPANPALLTDITNAKEYIERLSASKVTAHPHHATDDEIGAAEVYQTSIIFSHAPGGNVAPPWLVNLNAMVNNLNVTVNNLNVTVNNLNATVNNLTVSMNNLTVNVNNLTVIAQQAAADVALLRQRSEQLPILLANAQAGTHGQLYNPTALAHGWAPPLAPPNPLNRDQLLSFTVNECIVSAASLGLPVLLNGTDVQVRRRQIAAAIGVTI